MDMRLMKSANHFVMIFRRVFAERIPLSSFEDMGVAQGLLDKAMSSNDKELIAEAEVIAGILGLTTQSNPSNDPDAPASKAPTPSPNPTKSNQVDKAPTEEDWTFITRCAVKIGGPIGGILINQTRAESPATFQTAVDSIADKLGGFGNNFRREITTSKR
jgi:hypothetical protein